MEMDIKLQFCSLVEFLDYQLVNNIILFINVIICLSYPLNFAIYCGMSRLVDYVDVD